MANTDAKPLVFQKENQPQFEDVDLQKTISPFNVYNEEQLEAIERALKQANYLLPQVSDKEPPALIRGLVRYAIDPWHPLSSTSGDDGWVYYDGSNWVDFIIGTFTSAAPGIVPASGGGTVNFLRADGTWADPRGYRTFIASGTVSGTAVNFSSIPATYDDLWVEIGGLSHDNGSARTVLIDFSADGGANFLNTRGGTAGNGTSQAVAGAVNFPLTTAGISATEFPYVDLEIRNYTSTGAFKSIQGGGFDGLRTVAVGGVVESTSVINYIRLTLSGAGNFDGGFINLYGVKR